MIGLKEGRGDISIRKPGRKISSRIRFIGMGLNDTESFRENGQENI